MAKILVTGAGGFIGHHLGRYLKELGHEVHGVDLVEPMFSSKDEFDSFTIGDLRNMQTCLEVSEDMDWVFNLAALNGSIEFTTNNKAELIHNNALINLNMAEACSINDVKRVLFTSSACVYPLHLQETDEVIALKETDVEPAQPDTEYGWEKLFSEHVWKSYEADRGLEVRIARFFNIYGEEGILDTLKSKAPMALTKKVIDSENGDVYVWGDGTAKRSFCYISDCVEALVLLMESDINTPVNIGTTDLVSVDELVDLIAKIEGKEIKKIYQLDKVQGVKTRHVDLTKVQELLGWKAKVSMEEGLTAINKFAHEN